MACKHAMRDRATDTASPPPAHDEELRDRGRARPELARHDEAGELAVNGDEIGLTVVVEEVQVEVAVPERAMCGQLVGAELRKVVAVQLDQRASTDLSASETGWRATSIGLILRARSTLRAFAGCGAAWLARLSGGQEVPGSSPGSPTLEATHHNMEPRSDERDGASRRGLGGTIIRSHVRGHAAVSHACERYEPLGRYGRAANARMRSGRAQQCSLRCGANHAGPGEGITTRRCPHPAPRRIGASSAGSRPGSKHERCCRASCAASRRRPVRNLDPWVAEKLRRRAFRIAFEWRHDDAPGGRQPWGASSVESLHRRGPEASRQPRKVSRARRCRHFVLRHATGKLRRPVRILGIVRSRRCGTCRRRKGDPGSRVRTPPSGFPTPARPMRAPSSPSPPCRSRARLRTSLR